MLGLADEMADAFVELVQQISIERDAVVEQPVEAGFGQARDNTVAQRNDIIFACLMLEQRTFAYPAARGHPSERRHLAVGVRHRYFDQPAVHAYPCPGLAALVLDNGARRVLCELDIAQYTLLLRWVEQRKPGRGIAQGFFRGHEDLP